MITPAISPDIALTNQSRKMDTVSSFFSPRFSSSNRIFDIPDHTTSIGDLSVALVARDQARCRPIGKLFGLSVDAQCARSAHHAMYPIGTIDRAHHGDDRNMAGDETASIDSQILDHIASLDRRAEQLAATARTQLEMLKRVVAIRSARRI